LQIQNLNIGTIKLKWDIWYPWKRFKEDGRSKNSLKVPNLTPGVYEVRVKNAKKRLTIGKASNLGSRLKGGLVGGNNKHSAGIKIRKFEDTTRLEIRWAKTNRPSAAEEELHKRYKKKFGVFPKYVKHT